MGRVFSAALALLLLCACGVPKGPEPTAAPSPVPMVTPTPTPELTPAPTPEPTPEPGIWGVQTVRTDYRREDGTLLLEVDLSLPYAGAVGSGYEAVNAYYREELDQLTAEAAERAKDLTGLTAAEGNYSYLLASGGPVYEDQNLVCFAVYTEGYAAPAAHPFHQTVSDCFDLNTGRPLALPDLFTDWKTARARIWEALEPQIRLSRPADWVERSVQRAGESLDDTPFFLSDEGLTLHYNEYAIASYVEGTFDFLIPARVLADLTAYPIWDWGQQTFSAAYSDATGKTGLTVSLRLPRALGDGPACAAINAYYADLMEDIRVDDVNPEAEQLQSLSLSEDFFGWNFDFDFSIPLQTERLVSFRRTSFRCWGKTPEEDQYGEVFSLETGARLTFDDLFTVDRETAQARVLAEICAQDARARQKTDVWSYTDEALAEHFDSEQFYLTADGVVFYYHQFALGDRGHPEYEIPYETLEDIWALW